MSSLMKTTATQENPIYNMDVPDSSSATSDVTNSPTVDDAIVTLPAVSGNETFSLEICHNHRKADEEFTYCLTWK